MRFRITNRVRECKPVPLFEELEQRIVLDASVDSNISGHALDASHAGHGWNLEYASDPMVAMTPVLDTDGLAGYEATLDTVTWTSTFGGAETWVLTTVGAQTVDLSGRFAVDDDPTPLDGVEVIISGPGSGGWTQFDVAGTSGAGITGNGTLNLTINGSLAQVNAELATLTADLPAGYVGTPQATLTVHDLEVGAGVTNPSDAKTFERIIVSPPLQWSVDPSLYPTASFPLPGGVGTTDDTTADTFTYVNIGLGGFFVVDGSDFTPDSLPIVTLSAGGEWTLLHATAVGNATVDGNDTDVLSIQGTPAEINATLATLYGRIHQAYNGGTSIRYDYFDTDPNFPNPSHSGVFDAIFVDGANATPFLTAPMTATVNQNIPYDFTGTKLISVADWDWESKDMQVMYCSLSVDYGTLTIKDTSSLNKYTHVDDQHWEIEAYLPWLNEALKTLQYTGTKAGSDTLHIYVNDWANHGGAGVLVVPPVGGTAPVTSPTPPTGAPIYVTRDSEATVGISVLMTAIDNTPQIDMDPTATVVGPAPLAIPWPDPAHIITANDADMLDVSLRVHHGSFDFNGVALPAGVTTVVSDLAGPGDALLYLRGPQRLLNYSLGNLRYLPNDYGAFGHFQGDDLLTVTVMDNSTHLGSRDPVQRTQEQRLIITVT